MEKSPEFTIQDIQGILKTSERLNRHKEEIKRFLRIIEGFLEKSGEWNDFTMKHMRRAWGVESGSEIAKISFSGEPFKDYSFAIRAFYLSNCKWRMGFTLDFIGIRQNKLDIFSDNVDGLSRQLVPIFYLALPEILEALVSLFPKLKENIQELIQISHISGE